jgi:hypothetical protein
MPERRNFLSWLQNPKAESAIESVFSRMLEDKFTELTVYPAAPKKRKFSNSTRNRAWEGISRSD